MNHAYLITGGNIGDRRQLLAEAKGWLQQKCGTVVKESHFYETAAWGVTDQPSFYNQVLLLQTPLAAAELMQAILEIEATMGRIRKERYGPRIIDIDILLFNQDVIETVLVTVPHPQLANRRFVLAPLNELAPDYLHPILRQPINVLLANCNDVLEVRKLENR